MRRQMMKVRVSTYYYPYYCEYIKSQKHRAFFWVTRLTIYVTLLDPNPVPNPTPERIQPSNNWTQNKRELWLGHTHQITMCKCLFLRQDNYWQMQELRVGNRMSANHLQQAKFRYHCVSPYADQVRVCSEHSGASRPSGRQRLRRLAPWRPPCFLIGWSAPAGAGRPSLGCCSSGEGRSRWPCSPRCYWLQCLGFRGT